MTEAAAQSKTSPLAIWSLSLGIAGLALCLGLIAGLPAVICGHMALSQIKSSGDTLKGKGMAITGLITGYIAIFLVSIAVLGMVAGMLLPALATARERARRAETVNDLSQIGKACALYSMDNDDKEPSSLSDLTTYIDDVTIYISSASGNAPANNLNEVDTWSDYVLVPGLTEDSPSDAVQAYTKPGIFLRRGGVVLYVDGSVAWLNEQQYSLLLVEKPEL